MNGFSLPIYKIEGNQPECKNDSNLGLWYDKYCNTWKEVNNWEECKIDSEQKLSWINSIKK